MKVMKAVHECLSDLRATGLFEFRVTDLPFFLNKFHFHEECQLVYIVQGEGKRIIGDNICFFKPGELILVGANTPHIWHNDKKYFECEGENLRARSLSLFFDSGKNLKILSEMIDVSNMERLFQNAKRGIMFTGKSAKVVKEILREMTGQNEFDRLLSFLRILNTLATTPDIEMLANEGYVNTRTSHCPDRLDLIIKYIFNNFYSDVLLDRAAELAKMNKYAFCRYFKQRTQKTFINFVNEVRISYACRLLLNENKQIAEVCYESGFNSLSNFNKFFRDIKGMTPSEYIRMAEVS